MIARRVLLFAVLVGALAAAPAHAAFPGRNGAIVYGWHGWDGGATEQGLWTTSPADASRAPLLGCETPDDPNGSDACADFAYTDPAVAPDGRSVVFDAGPTLATVAFDGTGFQPLPARSADDGEPAFSSDGGRIVFTAGEPFRLRDRELWVADRSGAQARRLQVTGRQPTWSTRGWIAFRHEGHVYRVRPSGRHLRRVTRLRASAPAWSPDGRRLAYVANFRPSDPLEIGVAVFVANADGTRPHAVLRGATVDDVAWSPDGRRLVLVTSYEGLLVIGLRGRRLQNFYGGNESHADQELRTSGIDWQPLP